MIAPRFSDLSPLFPFPLIPMNDANTLRLIFSRAIRKYPDGEYVHLRPEQLVAAFGQSAAECLTGKPIDVKAIEDAARAARDAQLDILREERVELQTLKNAGHTDSRRELKEMDKLIAKCEQGQLVSHAVMSVNVGELKQAIADADAAPSESTDDSPAF